MRDVRPGESDPGVRIEHDDYSSPWEPGIPGLYRASLLQMKGAPILFDAPKAQLILKQFLANARFRGHRLLAISIMRNHLHFIVEAPDDLDPTRLLGDYKAYGSRILNQHYGVPPSNTWWTTNGSKRLLPDEKAVLSAIRYVLEKQPNPLVVWSQEMGEPQESESPAH